ncbi:MAG: MATE family efflux transporter [Eggerthellaceae bacterium]|nr:MATE family efflux transporter [Eggerthellaceae bacterium]
MVSNIAASLVATLYNLQMMRYFGEEGIAAYGVIMYVVMFFAAVFMGYSMGSAPLMSYQLGAKNTREMRCLLKKGLVFIGVSGIAMFALAQAFAQPIAQVFVGYDPYLADLTTEGFKIYSFAFLLMGFSIFGSSFFTSLNNGTISATISFLRTLVFEVGAILILPLLLGCITSLRCPRRLEQYLYCPYS